MSRDCNIVQRYARNIIFHILSTSTLGFILPPLSISFVAVLSIEYDVILEVSVDGSTRCVQLYCKSKVTFDTRSSAMMMVIVIVTLPVRRATKRTHVTTKFCRCCSFFCPHTASMAKSAILLLLQQLLL